LRSRSKSPGLDLDSINVEDEVSLDSLEKIKEKLMDKMGLDEDLNPLKQAFKDIEDGEITDSGDEEVNNILQTDLSKKLLKKTSLKIKSGSDKENQLESKKEKGDSRPEEDISIAACLKQYSEEDIENKLIPFKKRQFHELHIEEIKIKKQIERARSKSNTPVRSVSESSVSDCPVNTSTQNNSATHTVDTTRGEVKMSTTVSTGENAPARRVSRTNTRGDQSARVSRSEKKVSPIKLSLRGVVIERPSSSSSEAITENVEVILEKVEQEQTSEEKLEQDDNAVFHSMGPSTPPKQILPTDVSKDLFLTDDSDIEDSPVKVCKDPSSYISPFRKPEGPLDLSSPKRPPRTPQTKAADVSSPRGISELLKSPLVNNSILSPLASNTNARINFSQALTSTPCVPAPPTNTVKSAPALAPDHSPSSPAKKKKKKKTRLSRSATSSATT
jgi:hypothetical protein